ncbi:MAG: BON domain-containing protein [Acidobacteriota bacterium]|nr:BON domain-containing protein [Acidobacteriota bacterium]
MNNRRAVAALILFVLFSGFGVQAADKQVSDDLIYDNVKRKLAIDQVVKGGALDIDVKQGVVTLKGTVEYEKQKVKAGKITRKVSGVKSVVNEIQVKH